MTEQIPKRSVVLRDSIYGRFNRSLDTYAGSLRNRSGATRPSAQSHTPSELSAEEVDLRFDLFCTVDVASHQQLFELLLKREIPSPVILLRLRVDEFPGIAQTDMEDIL